MYVYKQSNLYYDLDNEEKYSSTKYIYEYLKKNSLYLFKKLNFSVSKFKVFVFDWTHFFLTNNWLKFVDYIDKDFRGMFSLNV